MEMTEQIFRAWLPVSNIWNNHPPQIIASCLLFEEIRYAWLFTIPHKSTKHKVVFVVAWVYVISFLKQIKKLRLTHWPIHMNIISSQNCSILKIRMKTFSFNTKLK